MKAILSLATMLSTFVLVNAQSLKKYPIGNSGCSVYNFCDIVFDVVPIDSLQNMTFGQCESEEVFYCVVCLKFPKAINNLDSVELFAIKSLGELKVKFDIIKSAGYGKGHRLNNNEATRGVIDYWEDKSANSYKVKAWTDGKYMGILFAYSQKELPETKVNVFLDGFRLP
jgi:hypothetical protein